VSTGNRLNMKSWWQHYHELKVQLVGVGPRSSSHNVDAFIYIYIFFLNINFFSLFVIFPRTRPYCAVQSV